MDPEPLQARNKSLQGMGSQPVQLKPPGDEEWDWKSFSSLIITKTNVHCQNHWLVAEESEKMLFSVFFYLDCNFYLYY